MNETNSLLDISSEYISDFGLKWQIEFLPGNRAAATSDIIAKKHTIFLPGNILDKPEYLKTESAIEDSSLGNLIHELGHAYLSETRGSTFSGAKVFTEDRKKLQNFIFIDNPLMDIWVNDEFYKRRPKIFEKHDSNASDIHKKIIETHLWKHFTTDTILYQNAYLDSELIRRNFERESIFDVLKKSRFSRTKLKQAKSLHEKLDPSFVARYSDQKLPFVVNKMSEIYNNVTNPDFYGDYENFRDYLANVSPLSEDPKTAREQHENCLNELCEFMKFDFRFKLVEYNRGHAWEII